MTGVVVGAATVETGVVGPDPDDHELSLVGRGSGPQRTKCAIVRVEQVRMAGEMVILR